MTAAGVLGISAPRLLVQRLRFPKLSPVVASERTPHAADRRREFLKGLGRPKPRTRAAGSCRAGLAQTCRLPDRDARAAGGVDRTELTPPAYCLYVVHI